MGKKGQRGQKGFTSASKSNHSNQSFVYRRRKSINSAAAAVGRSLTPAPINASLDRAAKANSHPQSPTEPPKDYFPMVGRQSLAKELNALAESDDIDDDDTPQYQTHLQRTSDEQHRGAILFHYINTFDCAPPEDWGDWYVDKQKVKGTISLIEDHLSSIVNRRTIKRTLVKIRECWEQDKDYNPAKNIQNLGRPYRIEVPSLAAQLIADFDERLHLSVAHITAKLNTVRELQSDANNFVPYTSAAVISCMTRMKPLQSAFVKRKQGSLTEASNWAKGRLNICAHLGVRMGLYDDDELYTKMIDLQGGGWRDKAALIPQDEFLDRATCARECPIDISRVCFYDEKHIKQKVGKLAYIYIFIYLYI